MSSNKPEKQKMATINEVYNRIIWDSRLNRNLFVAGFHERICDDMREKPLAHWDSSGDIPWHRIRYIRCGDVMVWDRDKRLDLISNNDLPAIAWKQDIFMPSEDDLAALLVNNRVKFKPRNIYKYQSKHENNHVENEWIIFTEATTEIRRSQKLNSLKIASYNVLCNLYEAEKIHTEKRLPAILAELQKCDADIIALQEVTPEFVEIILAENWVKNYFISESVSGKNVNPYGNLLMSKLPFTLVEHQFSGHKRVLVGSWNLHNQLFHLAVVHLTSSRAENSLQKRSRQLATVIDYLQQQSGDCCIVGDFNIRGAEQQEIFNYGNFVDVWQKLHPNQDGYTFDTERNPLAMIMSLEGKPARLDRILLRQGEGFSYKPISVNLFGCEPIAGTQGKIYPSDHFGIRGVLEFNSGNSQKSQSYKTDLTKITPVYQSAVVIIPPDDILPVIQEIRQQYDPRFERWMPHITLLCGFLPESYFEEAVEIIAPVLAKLQPFALTLADFQTFSHQKTSTAWLHPVVEKNALHELQSTLQQLFPQCYEQGTKNNTGFTPHLTVGQFSTPGEAKAKLPQWHPVKFMVNSVVLTSRRDDQPCMVRYVVGLGNNSVEKVVSQNIEISSELMQLVNELAPELTQVEKLQRDTVLDILKQACTESLGFDASLYLLGSARLGVETFESDVDVVCLIPNYVCGEAFLASVQQRLAGLCEKTQLVVNAKVPVLRLQIEGISLDLLYAQVEIEFGKKIDKNIQNLHSKIKNQKSIIGCWEADLIVDLVKQNLSLDDFRLFLKAIRAWAKCRCIYGNSWGFLGGFSFTLLAAWICINSPNLILPSNSNSSKLEVLLYKFFQLLNRHNWHHIIALTDAGKNYEVQHPRDWLPIVTSIKPCQNTARNVTRSTANILQQEFRRGAEITEEILAGKQKWQTLFLPVNLQQESEELLVIEIISLNNLELEKMCGLLESYIIGLIIQLEQIDIFVRPWNGIEKNHKENGQNNARIRLGLNIPERCDRTIITELAENFISQFQLLHFSISLQQN